ncbi:MAG: hypothetical protein JNJ54_31830 [Myxococcaceae bacterium]|nr:hypothetical protein [Myxococcaceae bacterium]
MTATCATHEGVAAVGTCKRCGVFMCDACTLHGTEDRCLACRPRRTAEEREERRANALNRASWMVCESCDYLGPRFERVGPPTRSDRNAMLVLTFFFCFVGATVSVMSAVRGFAHPECPRCGAISALWPAPVGTETRGLDAHAAAVAQQEREWFARRKSGFFWAAATILVTLPFPMAGLVSLFFR